MANAIRRHDPYQKFAPVYDLENHEKVARGFFKRMRPYLPRDKQSVVYDLGCGTGLLSELIARRGHIVCGVDRSLAMLRAARRRCRELQSRVRFIARDLMALPKNTECELAVSCGEVVNHFRTTAQLTRLFTSVRQSLRPGGRFIFDEYNSAGFEHYWDGHTYFEEMPDGDLVLECEYFPKQRRGTIYIISYHKSRDGDYRKSVSWLTEYAHAASELRSCLARAGFGRINREEWSPWPMKSRSALQERTFWVATAE